MSKKKTYLQQRTALKVLCIVLGMLLTILLAGTAYVEHLLDQMTYVDPNETQPRLSAEEADALLSQETETVDPDFTGPELNEEDVHLEDTDALIGGDGIVNILLIGQDTTDENRSRSDSMILVTFNKERNTITMTSFMRDMYVKIPGYKKNRINVAYLLGGMQLLDETLYNNFGVEIDGNVEIDFSHFKELIDLLGGIELELNYKEADFVNLKTRRYTLEAGTQQLDGEQALWYARFRGDALGDFNRTNRQRIVLNTLLENYKNAKLTTLIGMLDDILPMVTTDLTKSEIVSYVTELFPMLATAEVITQRIPVDGAYEMARIDGMSVLVPNISKNVQALVDSLVEFEEDAGVG